MEERSLPDMYPTVSNVQVTHLAHTCTSLVNPQRRESRCPLCCLCSHVGGHSDINGKAYFGQTNRLLFQQILLDESGSLSE